jgi:DNA-directed RNA polymerase specialized sigma24 family protein
VREKRRDTIRTELELLAPLVAEALEARDWEFFGYDSWAGYAEAEFGSFHLPRLQRREGVVLLRSRGVSVRAIADGLGVSEATVERDLAVGMNAPGEPTDTTTPIDSNTQNRDEETT